MNNPYVILNISESATNEEIEIARKKQLKLQCGVDENKKDENGEYLSYVINQAADDLLDPDKRKVIDEKIHDKNVPVLFRESDKYLPQVILTGINDELIKNNNKIVIKKKFFEKKVECKQLYIGILNSGNCIYLIQECHIINNSKTKYFLVKEYFTQKCVIPYYFLVDERPWNRAEIFNVDGLLAIAFPAYQVLPNSIIYNGKISEDTLRKILPVICNVVKKDASKFKKLFQEEEEKLKVYKK